MTTYDAAIDTMYSVFKNEWDANAATIVGYTPIVSYDEPDSSEREPLDAVFARLTVRNVNDTQIGMGACGGDTKLYETSGLLVVQIFIPKQLNTGVTQGRALATMVKNAYRRRVVDDSVVFRNAILRELTPDTRWRQINVNVEYEFTEVT